MTLQPEPEDNSEIEAVEGRVAPSGGIYELPVLGNPARRTRQFFDDLAPSDTDSPGVAAGKNALRYGTVVGAGVAGTAVAAVLVL